MGTSADTKKQIIDVCNQMQKSANTQLYSVFLRVIVVTTRHHLQHLCTNSGSGRHVGVWGGHGELHGGLGEKVPCPQGRIATVSS